MCKLAFDDDRQSTYGHSRYLDAVRERLSALQSSLYSNHTRLLMYNDRADGIVIITL